MPEQNVQDEEQHVKIIKEWLSKQPHLPKNVGKWRKQVYKNIYVVATLSRSFVLFIKILRLI